MLLYIINCLTTKRLERDSKSVNVWKWTLKISTYTNNSGSWVPNDVAALSTEFITTITESENRVYCSVIFTICFTVQCLMLQNLIFS